MDARRSLTLLIVCAAGLGLVALAVMLVTLAPSSSAEGVNIWLIGYTNSADGPKQSAVFAISNSTRRVIGFAVMPVQIDSGIGWSAIDRSAGPGLVVKPLERGQTSIFDIPVPNRGISWRVPVWWGYRPNRIDWFRSVADQNWRRLKAGLPLRGLNVGIPVEGYTNFSVTLRPAFLHE